MIAPLFCCSASSSTSGLRTTLVLVHRENQPNHSQIPQVKKIGFGTLKKSRSKLQNLFVKNGTFTSRRNTVVENQPNCHIWIPISTRKGKIEILSQGINGNTTICQYYKLSEYIFVSEIFVNIPNVILSNVIAKELSKVCILMIIAILSEIFVLNLSKTNIYLKMLMKS